jgi:HD-like signal output (HDOD) protein
VTSTIKLDQLSFPNASTQATKVLAYLATENPNLEELDNIIMHDPVLAGMLIRYANSPLYHRGGNVSNVPAAVQLIGLKNVRSAAVMSTLHASMPLNDRLSQAILNHSLLIAALCKLIARKCCPQAADDLELMGLIHDVGMIMLASNFNDDYQVLLERSETEGIPLDELEKAHFGFSHDQIAARLLHDFRLPKRHEQVLIHFHQREAGDSLAADMIKERAVLLLAHHLLAQHPDADALHETLFDTVPHLVTMLGLDEEQVAEISGQIPALKAASIA